MRQNWQTRERHGPFFKKYGDNPKIQNMSYKINRLVKSKSREGDDEIFMEILVTDDLGTYPYGKWLDADELAGFKTDMGKTNFEAAKTLAEFKFVNPDLKALHKIIADHLPRARKHKEDADWQENYEKQKKIQELGLKGPITKEDRDLIKAELRAELKEEIKAEILKEIKG